QFDVRHRLDLTAQRLRRGGGHPAQPGFWLLPPRVREDAGQEESDGVEGWPPGEAAEEQNLGTNARLARGAGGRRSDPAICCRAALATARDAPGPEVALDAARVLGVDNDGARRLGIRPALEALELPPLPPDEPALQQVRFGLGVAPPDERLDVVGHHQPADAVE